MQPRVGHDLGSAVFHTDVQHAVTINSRAPFRWGLLVLQHLQNPLRQGRLRRYAELTHFTHVNDQG